MHAIRFVSCLASLSLIGSGAADNAPVQNTREKNATAFVSVLLKSFSTWDTDKDGTLQTPELDAAVANATIVGDQAAALSAVKRASRTRKVKLPPFTLENLKTLAFAAPAKDQPDLGGMYVGAQKKIADSDKKLFSRGTPSLDMLHQGKLGDCFCLAPFGAMLHRDASQVKAMFKPRGDGTYDVTLGQQTVQVAIPTDAEIAMSSSTETSGIWSNMYEKAAGLARNAEKPEEERVGTPVDAIARGGSAGTMLAFITGHEIVRFSCSFARDEEISRSEAAEKLTELRSLLMSAVAERRLITTGTNSGASGPTVPGISGGHAYAVLGYNAVSDQIQLWDPHGDTFTPNGKAGRKNGYPRKDGVFWMPLRMFVKQYAGLAFEQFPKVAGEADPQRAAD